MSNEYEEYDPTLPERPNKDLKYDGKRPYNYCYLHSSDFKVGNLFQVWPDYPLQIVQYGKYYLRWEYKTVPTSTSYFHRMNEMAIPQVSIDKNTWFKLEELTSTPYRTQIPNPKPIWWNKQELIDGINEKYKKFKNARSRLLAQQRKNKLEIEAEKAGIDFKEYKTQKAEEKRVKQKKKRRHKEGMQLADTLNRKMKLAMVLKDLRDETDELQSKLEDETSTLDLTYIDEKLVKIKRAIRVLKVIGTN